MKVFKMIVKILASGSSGNCIVIQSGEVTILVDAGIAKTKIEKRLLEEGIRADEINAIFISHSHKDHVKGLPLANKYQIPVYASEGEWKDINSMVDDGLQFIVFAGHHLAINNGLDWLDITPFGIHHDAYEPLGYSILSSDDQKVSICLDTGKVDFEMLEAMKNSDIYIIESNHEEAMVEVSDYPTSIKARILSDLGHLSNSQCAVALQKLVQGKGEKIFLTHLSSSNNMKSLAKMTVTQALRKKGFQVSKHYEIEVV